MMRLLTLPGVSELEKVPRDEVPAEMTRLAALQMALAARWAGSPTLVASPTGSPSPRYITAKELATLLSLRPDRVYELARMGRIPCVRTGKRAMRFDVGAVRKALAS